MDDGEYFQTLPENSVFIFLRSGEIWRPEGTDAVRAGKLKNVKMLSCTIHNKLPLLSAQ